MSSRYPEASGAAAGGRPRRRRRALVAGVVVLGVLAIVSLGRGHLPGAAPARTLRVCADPNNLPFSNERREGLENRLAELVAADLGARVEYTWWAQRRGFIRNTLGADLCDVVMGIPGSFELALATRPYYRSTYVFVYRRDADLALRSFDDPALRTLRIGVQMVGDDYANTPPAHALANRGIIDNVRGFMVYGDYRDESPAARIIEAVAAGEIDVAVAWGPLAGYFASRQSVPLEIAPVAPQIDLPFLPFVYDIALGVKHGNDSLRAELDDVLVRRRADIGKLLDEFGVPRVGPRTATPVT